MTSAPPASERGLSLLELCVVLALTGSAFTAVASGAGTLGCGLRVEAARSTVIGACLEARRFAYLHGSSAVVETGAGNGEVTLQPAGITRSLGRGVVVTSAPTDGNVSFAASGLADNATVRIACGNATAAIVVNQRGVVR